jgi:hypothetical protein
MTENEETGFERSQMSCQSFIEPELRIVIMKFSGHSITLYLFSYKNG